MLKFIRPKIIVLLIAIAIGGTLAWRWNKSGDAKKSTLFETQQPKKRTLRRTVDVTGTLEVKDTMKISSLINGTVKEILVEENDIVKKGDVLAIIDNGKDDSDVIASQAMRDQAKSNLEYQKNHFRRIKKLHSAGHVADDTFEQERATIEVYEGKLASAEATLTKYEIEYENTKIKAPDNGIVISILVSEGAGISATFNVTVLFEVAKDLTKMNAVLDADEADIGVLKEGQKIELTFDCYPNKVFDGTINRISYASRIQNGVVSFRTEVSVDNSANQLRPGMTVNATVMIAEVKNVSSITGQAFYISQEALKLVAKQLELQVKELDKIPTGEQSVWIKKGCTFEEHSVKTGVTDEVYYEILSGIADGDAVIIDVEEKSKLEAAFKKAFKTF